MSKQYQMRRQKIGELMKDNSMLVLFAGQAKQMSEDAVYPFVVNKNFYYLSGIARQNFKLVITKRGGEIKSRLFIEKPDYDVEKWLGRKMTKKQAKQISAIDLIAYDDQFDAFITAQSYAKVDYVYTDISRLSEHQLPSAQSRWLRQYAQDYPHIGIENANQFFIDMRMIKSAEEIAAIERAIAMTKDGLEEILKRMKPGMYEYQLDAIFKYTINYQGANGHSFDTIAASAEDATILHYTENNKQLAADSLVLLDLGALSGQYSADISRTYPVSGKYTTRQKQLYNIVLTAMDVVMAEIKPGVPFTLLNETCKRYLSQALQEINLIKHDDELSKYYYHGVSHHLGLDVHDLSDREAVLKEGMVLTVEPGLYIAEEAIGIRIEDDVLVTRDGCRNLSSDIIKRAEDIEQFIERHNRL